MARERPPLKRRDVIKAIRRGLTPFTVDRELVQDLRDFLEAPIGCRVEVRGLIVFRGEQAKLRPLPMNPFNEIEIEGLDQRVARALHGEPVHVYGIKVGKDRLRVDELKLQPLVSKPPPVELRYVRDRLLDGIELGVPEDLAVFVIVSSPPIQGLGVRGGIHAALAGRGRSYLDKSLRVSVLSIPLIWSYRKVEAPEYGSYSPKRLVAELSLNIDVEVEKLVASIPSDFPLIVKNAQPKLSALDFDILDYAVYTKVLRPRSRDPIKTIDYATKLAQRLATWIETSGLPTILIGEGKLVDLNVFGKPSAVLRIASALARASWSLDFEPFLDTAFTMLTKAIENAAELVSTRPTKVVKLRDFEKEILRIIDKLESSYPDGVPFDAIARELGLRGSGLRELELALRILRNHGLVYCPRIDRYKLVRV